MRVESVFCVGLMTAVGFCALYVVVLAVCAASMTELEKIVREAMATAVMAIAPVRHPWRTRVADAFLRTNMRCLSG